MFNPPPGIAHENMECDERPGECVYDLPLGLVFGETGHAHVNPYGITYRCTGGLKIKESET